MSRLASPNIRHLVVPQLEAQQEMWLEFFAPYHERIRTFKCPTFPKPNRNKVRSDERGSKTWMILPKRQLWREYLELPAESNDGRLLERLFQLLGTAASKTPLCSYIDKPEQRYRIKPETAKALQELEARDESSFCLLPVGCDHFHSGKSPSSTVKTLRDKEFALDSLSAFSLLMVCKQPQLNPTDVHHLYCPGAEYDAQGKGTWNDTPRWDVELGEISLDWNWDVRSRRNYQNLTGFIE